MYIKNSFMRMKGIVQNQLASSEGTTWSEITSTLLGLDGGAIGVNFPITLMLNTTAVYTLNPGCLISQTTTVPTTDNAFFLPVNVPIDILVPERLALWGNSTNVYYSAIIWDLF
jgi:hypothetical protein